MTTTPPPPPPLPDEAQLAASGQQQNTVLLDRSAGPPRLRFGTQSPDERLIGALVSIRRAPRPDKDAIMQVGPACLEILRQISRIQSDRYGWGYPEDHLPYPGLGSFGNIAPPQSYVGGLPNPATDFSAYLNRLDDSALEVAEVSCQGVYWSFLAFSRIKEFFPEVFAGLEVGHFRGWWEIFWAFYHLVHRAGWFPINWALLEHLFTGWRAGNSNPHHLLNYLIHIPVQVYGIGDAELLDEYPVLAYMHGLLVNHAALNPNEAALINACSKGASLPPPGQLYHKVISSNLSHLPPPLCYLGHAALIVSGEADNPILDVHFRRDTLTTSRLFLWARDVEMLKEAWYLAEPIVSNYLAFLDWFDGDNDYSEYWPANMDDHAKLQAVINTLLEIGRAVKICRPKG